MFVGQVKYVNMIRPAPLETSIVLAFDEMLQASETPLCGTDDF